MKIRYGVIAYRLLNNASILESHKQLISQSNTTRFQICSYEETMFAKKRVFAKTVTAESIDCELPELCRKIRQQ